MLTLQLRIEPLHSPLQSSSGEFNVRIQRRRQPECWMGKGHDLLIEMNRRGRKNRVLGYKHDPLVNEVNLKEVNPCKTDGYM